MVRDLVTPTPNPEHATTPWYPSNTWTYTDSEDLLPYADSTIVNSGTAAFTPASRYQTGVGIAARETLNGQGQVTSTTHLHGDLIRSTNLTTDDAGDGESAVAYTAFGEMLGASDPAPPPPAGFPR